MDPKVKVIIKRPDEKVGHVTNISTSLRNLQKTVEGYIENLGIGDGVAILMNEDGKYRGLEHNFFVSAGPYKDEVVGTVIVVKYDGEGNIVDLPDKYLQTWKKMLYYWGN